MSTNPMTTGHHWSAGGWPSHREGWTPSLVITNWPVRRKTSTSQPLSWPVVSHTSHHYSPFISYKHIGIVKHDSARTVNHPKSPKLIHNWSPNQSTLSVPLTTLTPVYLSPGVQQQRTEYLWHLKVWKTSN